MSATYVVDRFGSASRGDLAFGAGDALGKLLRMLYLCDYLGNPAFRADILGLLNQGEAMHSLERAIHSGGIGAKRGRTPEQMAAISGALSLVANILMTWNAWRMQAVVRQAPEQFPQELLGKSHQSHTRTSTCAASSPSCLVRTVDPCSAQTASCRPGQ